VVYFYRVKVAIKLNMKHFIFSMLFIFFQAAGFANGCRIAQPNQPYKEQFFVTNLGQSIEKT